MSQEDIDRVNEEIKSSKLYVVFKLVFEILSKPIIALLNRLTKS
jgi:hypothetical protein